MRKWLFFTFVAFVMAMIHACSLNNSIIKPNCQVFQFEMADKWWTPTGETGSQMYFSSAGDMKTKTGTDNVTYTIQNCNSLLWVNHTSGESKEWIIKQLDPKKMVLQMDNKQMVTFTSAAK